MKYVLPLLGVLFVGLKLTNYITWSWLWVLAPFWISFLLSIIVVTFLALLTYFTYYR